MIWLVCTVLISTSVPLVLFCLKLLPSQWQFNRYHGIVGIDSGIWGVQSFVDVLESPKGQVDMLDGRVGRISRLCCTARWVLEQPKFPIHRKDASRMSPTTLEASRGYRVGNYDRLLCHHGREVNTRRHSPARVRREGSWERSLGLADCPCYLPGFGCRADVISPRAQQCRGGCGTCSTWTRQCLSWRVVYFRIIDLNRQ